MIGSFAIAKSGESGPILQLLPPKSARMNPFGREKGAVHHIFKEHFIFHIIIYAFIIN